MVRSTSSTSAREPSRSKDQRSADLDGAVRERVLFRRNRMRRVLRTTGLMIVAGSLAVGAQQSGALHPVSNQDVIDGLKDPTRWLTFGGNYSIHGFSEMVSRGFDVLGDRLNMGPHEEHLVALDRKPGAAVWDSTVEEPKNGYAITLAPLVVKNRVVVGVAGGDYATRGFIDAYDAE